MPEVKMPEVDVAGMTTQTKDRVTGAAKNVQGNVTHTVELLREAVGV